MRVVAGTARGRTLHAPRGGQTRPTSDRVREAVFASLGSSGCFDPDRSPRTVDLFAGSGALGIEALSRGATAVTFVDADADAVATIRHNLRELDFDGSVAEVIRSDVPRWVASHGAPVLAAADVVLADPPYRFTGWCELLDRIAASGFGGILVAEAGGSIEVAPGWNLLRERRYGTTVVHLLRPEAHSGVPAHSKGGV